MSFVRAFVCEINEDSVKMFDWKQQLMEVKKTEFEDDIELGNFYEIDEYEGKYIEVGENLGADKDTDLKVFVKEGVVHTKVLAFAPNEAALEVAGLSEYRNTAYSLQLQVLRDPNDFFFDFPQSEVGLATVKYAPMNNSVFEVVDVEEVPESYKECLSSLEHLVSEAPWNVIQSEQVVQELSKPSKTDFRVCTKNPIPKTMEFIGVCIEKHVKADGTVLHNFYSSVLGIVKAKDSTTIRVGDWYHFTLNDDRKSKTKNCGDKDLYLTASIVLITASLLQQQLPTRVVGMDIEGNIEEHPTRTKNVLKMEVGENTVECPVFTTSFMLSSIRSDCTQHSSVMDWQRRFERMQSDGFFYSPALGKVKVCLEKCKEILQRVEASPEKIKAQEDANMASRWKSGQIVVEVDVVPLPFSVTTNRKNPRAAMFHVKKVLRISWLIGGKSID